ncbi:hypothetical protein BKA80DRAFT_271835 [Phyllosticta citrichinensis]
MCRGCFLSLLPSEQNTGKGIEMRLTGGPEDSDAGRLARCVEFVVCRLLDLRMRHPPVIVAPVRKCCGYCWCK